MIDTLNLELDKTYFDHKHIQQMFDEKMEFKAATRFKNGSSTTVNYKNYRFTLTDRCLTAKGSLTKLFLGNNVENLSFQQVQTALMQFETLFGIPFDNAKIKRLDIACNIQVDNPVNMYFDLLTTPNQYKLRLYEGETKYFVSSKNKLSFYDKVEQFSKNDRVSYSKYQYSNILKYEISHSKNLVKNLNLPDASMKHLYNLKVCENLLNLWHQGYQKVPKLTATQPSQLCYKSLSTFKQSIIVEGVRSLGGIQNLNMAVNQSEIKKNVKHLIKNYLNDFCDVEPFSPILQHELDTKIDLFYNNQLRLLS
jgi:YHS domain-containing protein